MVQEQEYARVYLLDTPYAIDRAFDYFIPSSMRTALCRGSFVTVPFGKGNRSRLGVVTDFTERTRIFCCSNGFSGATSAFIKDTTERCRCATCASANSAGTTIFYRIISMSTVSVQPFGNREIINMSIGANDNKSLGNQLSLKPVSRVTLSSVGPRIAVTFRLFLIECRFLHRPAVGTIMPCRESNCRNIKAAVLRIRIILSEIRRPAKFLNPQTTL